MREVGELLANLEYVSWLCQEPLAAEEWAERVRELVERALREVPA